MKESSSYSQCASVLSGNAVAATVWSHRAKDPQVCIQSNQDAPASAPFLSRRVAKGYTDT